MKVKDKNGNWVDISDVSVKTHGGSAQPSNPLLQTIPCYPNPYSNNNAVTHPVTGEEISGEAWPEGYYDCIVFLDSSFNPIPFDKDNLDEIYYIIKTGGVGSYQTIYYKSSGTYNSPTGLPPGICPCDPQYTVIRFNRLEYNEEAESNTLRAYQMVDRYEYNETTQQNEYVNTEENTDSISIQFNVSQPMQLPIAQLLLSGYYGG